MPKQVWAKIIANRRVAPDYFRLVMEAPSLVREILPGQFVHVRVENTYAPLLRRPLSIYTWDRESGYIQLLYQTVGVGTDLLSRRRPGEEVDILGPLGKGFSWEPELERIALVGGGIGIAPLLGTAQTASRQGKEVTSLLGARNSASLVDQGEFAAASESLWLATDDGSLGYPGPVTGLLEELLREGKTDLVLACGPWPMLRAVANISGAYGVRCQVSLEARMGCGLGACRGCAFKAKTPAGEVQYKMVCQDGPVFDAREVSWDE